MIVSIIQRRLTHYRVAFFNGLREKLAQDNVTLRLFHGVGASTEKLKNDTGYLEWAEPLDTRYLAKESLCWQPFSRVTRGSDLVILPQENAMLCNHIALWSRPSVRLAFWGHGANLQGKRDTLRERYRRWSTRKVDWFFAYTSLTEQLVIDSGFPSNRITCVDNAIDTMDLKAALSTCSIDKVSEFRALYSIPEDHVVGLFLGSLYPLKRLEFLISAAKLVRDRVKNFHLVVVGDGPARDVILNAMQKFDWISYVGAVHSGKKAVALRTASILLNPGVVGLGVLDSFIARVPMVTTDCGIHSPEIAYLNSGNGIVSENNIDSFVTDCERLLQDADLYERLKLGCRESADKYTLNNMINKFSGGIIEVLDSVA